VADITITAHWVTREPAKGGGTLHFLMAGEVVLAMIDEYETECAIKYRVLGAQYIVDYVAQSLDAAKAYVAAALRKEVKPVEELPCACTLAYCGRCAPNPDCHICNGIGTPKREVKRG